MVVTMTRKDLCYMGDYLRFSVKSALSGSGGSTVLGSGLTHIHITPVKRDGPWYRVRVGKLLVSRNFATVLGARKEIRFVVEPRYFAFLLAATRTSGAKLGIRLIASHIRRSVQLMSVVMYRPVSGPGAKCTRLFARQTDPADATQLI
jgi:hypothetical protein